MAKFTSKLIKTDVTFVQLYKEYVLCGIGAYLHVFSLNPSKLLHKENIFNGLKINCIRINSKDDCLVCTGENVLKLVKVDWKVFDFNAIAERELKDWILDTIWLDSEGCLATVTMHNVVHFWSDTLQLQGRSVCEENCILYCARISYDKREELVVLAGTVFSEILIWRPNQLNVCPVLIRLCGHDGVLFSIEHDISQGYICSTSDDRSAILWSYNGNLLDILDSGKDTTGVSLHKKLYGHTARCFRSRIITDSVITTGEDGLVNLWDLSGTQRRRIDAHQGESVWAIDADAEKNVLITGGSDAGVTVFPIKSVILHLQLPPLEDVPKMVVLLKHNGIVVITERGLLFCYDHIKNKWSFVGEHQDLKSYCLLEVSLCRNQVALAGFHGHIFLYRLVNSELELTCSKQSQSRSRIFSLHWLNCDNFLTCESDGLLFLRRHEKGQLLLLNVMQLPPSKERWSTAACLCSGGIVVGDRKGNLYLYSTERMEPLQTIKKAHNYLGITNVYYDGEIITSLGRNSTIRKFKVNTNKTALIPITSDKLPFSWLVSLNTNKDTTLLIIFSGRNVIFWDYRARRVLLETKCGGGHRSNDFHQSGNDICYTYIKDKRVNLIVCEWNSIRAYDLIEGINQDEINSLRCLKFCEELYLISGGEDTTLRVSTYKNNEFKQLSVLKSHLSSIRCLHVHMINDKEYYLYSAGGRAQIISWRINQLTCVQLFSHYAPLKDDESEIRVMDLCTATIRTELLLLAACSDGKVKIYRVNDDKITYSTYIQYELKCILKLTVIKHNDSNILVTMATDGYLMFWNLENSNEPICTIKVNQSGINSYSWFKSDGNSYLFLTGGDDNTLTLIYFTINDLQIKLVTKFSNSESHCAQITGVYLSREYFLSAGLDKKLILFKYSIIDCAIKVESVGAYETSISDVKGMEVFEYCNTFEVTLYGLGVEILDVEKCVL